MEAFEKNESKLQEQLLKLCDSKGKEINLHNSATIFNELGLLYQTKSPSKINLIRSAALLNAAILRQPDKQEFHENLQQLCQHVLECAKASQKHANLVKISQTAAN